MNTLSSIAIEAGKTKRTVQGWVSALETRENIKLGTMDGGVKTFTDAEKAMILACAPPREAVQAREVHVEVGNHSIVVAPPELPTKFNLEALRDARVESISIDNPMAFVDQFLNVANQLQTVMEADLAAREKKLKDTQAANQKLGVAIQEIKVEQRFYQERARTLDKEVAEETTRLQSSAQELGKLRSE